MQIALIGAGPRNLAILDRLIQKADSNQALTINIFDPYPVGGRVWNPFFENNQTYLMNTNPNQVTLFNDYDIGQRRGDDLTPNLLTWAQSYALAFLKQHHEYPMAYREEVLSLTSMTAYASRGLMGVYAAWFFEEILKNCPSNLSVRFHQVAVKSLLEANPGFNITTTDYNHFFADKVVLALGHLDAELSEKKKDLEKFAKEKGFHYYPASHPAENDFSNLNENDTVLVQGLGLSFFDDLLSLTAGKGGSFLTKKDGSLVYHPSGHEPHLIIGSGSGLPPRAHGLNQKGANELYQPRFFTLERMQRIAKDCGGHLPYNTFRHVLDQEMTYKYLTNQVNLLDKLSDTEKEEILDFLENPKNWQHVNEKFHLKLDVHISWEKEATPSRDVTSLSAFRNFFVQHLKEDIDSAALGNDKSPLTGAYDILRDVRGTVRTLYNDRLFDEDDYQKLLTDFKLFDSQLSVGPPLIRIRQLLALIKAKQVTIAGPNFSVDHDQQFFTATDRFDEHYQGTALIEARLGRPDFRTAKSPLLKSLRQHGLIVGDNRIINQDGTAPLANTIKVNLKTFTVYNKENQLIPNLFVTGVPLEGQSWFTTVIPRPHVQTIAFTEAATVVHQILNQ
ncbi:FAD/NAD(P)-binding protein [Fructobacillus cardui]|uniref:FAD/NAD(P)-binding protein n=1 Tax=Fructobacillus cardui TaxID=2893170 RepID=UPI002DA4F350|nr:Uncharacterized NAD(P)/FAD-binding protein YdhS (YdhS) [Fructobacillus cardui]